MKRATRFVVLARLSQRHARVDHVDYIGAHEQFVDETFGDPAGHSGYSIRRPLYPCSGTPVDLTGPELGLDLGTELTHVRAPLCLRLEGGHDFAHVFHG